MKLYLSSYRVPVPEALTALLPAEPPKVRTALIPNSKDYYADRARSFKINEHLNQLREMGFNPDVVDLKDFDSPEPLATKLKQYDFIWVTGGNTFNLRYEMQRSGFDKVIKQLLEDGLVYAGDSAGAVIVGPTIRGVELLDEAEFAEEPIFEGLNIVPDLVIPHADNLGYKEPMAKLIEMYKGQPNVTILNDDQVLVIDGDKRTVLTAGLA